MKLKKIVSAICAAAISLSFAAFPASANEADNGSLLVMGDSIATGYRLIGYKRGDNSSAPDSFYNLLAPDFKSSANLAVDGTTTEGLLQRFKSDKDFVKQVKKADKIVISIGGNDFLMPLLTTFIDKNKLTAEEKQQVKDGTLPVTDATKAAFERAYKAAVKAAESVDIAQTKKNLLNIFKKINGYNPDAEVYIFTVYDPFENSPVFGELGTEAEKMLKKLNNSIKSAAKKYDKVHVVDVYTAFKGNSLTYTNALTIDVHPSKKGHAKMYEMLLKSFADTSDFKHIERKAEEVTGNSRIDSALDRYGDRFGITDLINAVKTVS